MHWTANDRRIRGVEMSDRNRYTGITTIEAFEIRAETFRLMTGHMAPGKDQSASGNDGMDEGERRAMYEAWSERNSVTIAAVMRAYHKVIPRDDE